VIGPAEWNLLYFAIASGSTKFIVIKCSLDPRDVPLSQNKLRILVKFSDENAVIFEGKNILKHTPQNGLDFRLMQHLYRALHQGWNNFVKIYNKTRLQKMQGLLLAVKSAHMMNI